MIAESINKAMLQKTDIKGGVLNKINVIKKAITGYGRLREANRLCMHFSNYFSPIVATNSEFKAHVHRIRHEVFSEELKLEEANIAKQEKDEFDAYSSLCLIQHSNSLHFAGTIRVVSPTNSHELLPIEKYCSSAITDEEFHPKNFKRSEICEISRLCMPKEFRRRKVDNHDGAGMGVINEHAYSPVEMRYFPFIAVGLYFIGASHALLLGKKHAFVMMEPRLARSMRMIGIKFKQIGPIVEYHGKRAPYYINKGLLSDSLSKGFKIMLNHISSKLQDTNIYDNKK